MPSLVALAIVLAVGLLSGCAGSPPSPPVTASTAEASVVVIDRGWHTDIGLAVDQLSGPIAGLARVYPDASYLVFGFGDRAFYMAPDDNLGDMLAAIFPGPGVILLTALRVPPDQAFGAGNVVNLSLSRPALDRVQSFLWQSLYKREDGSVISLGPGPYPGSVFYGSGRTYDLLQDCNYWTALALSNGGLPIDPDNIIFARQVMAEARRIAARQSDANRSSVAGRG